ncbi:MAG TPA: hypothetical protein VKZ56_09805, partial [Membranihabitans sp.]|nr:hypothetical protein [Membranihabitans sp.]
TFMVEMIEAANIINNFSSRSLILLDEIGRGTSTYDGISIAWSMTEYLHEHPTAHPKTLFATHYHELNQLEELYDRIRNFHVSTKEVDNRIIFLRKLVPGGSEHSFGIHVAQMAGLPQQIIDRAGEILEKMEGHHLSPDDGHSSSGPRPKKTSRIKPTSNGNALQLQIFDVKDENTLKIKEQLSQLDINRLSPIESLLKLKELQNMMEK